MSLVITRTRRAQPTRRGRGEKLTLLPLCTSCGQRLYLDPETDDLACWQGCYRPDPERIAALVGHSTVPVISESRRQRRTTPHSESRTGHRLTAEERAWIATHLDDLSYEQIAAQIGATRSTVAYHAERIRQRAEGACTATGNPHKRVRLGDLTDEQRSWIRSQRESLRPGQMAKELRIHRNTVVAAMQEIAADEAQPMKIHPATAIDFAWIEFDTEDESEIEAIARGLQELRRSEGVTLSVEEVDLVTLLADHWLGKMVKLSEEEYWQTKAQVYALRARLRATAGHSGE